MISSGIIITAARYYVHDLNHFVGYHSILVDNYFSYFIVNEHILVHTNSGNMQRSRSGGIVIRARSIVSFRFEYFDDLGIVLAILRAKIRNQFRIFQPVYWTTSK